MNGRGAETRRRPHRRDGLSLLEVMLAIAILGGSLVVLAELVRIGSRASREARELTVAQLLCEAKLNEVALGFVPAQATSQQPCETDPNWTYSIDVQPGDVSGLMIVMVRVAEANPSARRPLEYTLMRWIVDPNVEAGGMSGDAGTSASGASATGTGAGTTTSGATGAASGS